MLYLVFDTETTGTEAGKDDVIQLAYTVLDEEGNIVDARSEYLNTDVEISAGAFAVHNIDRAFLEEHAGSYFLHDFIVEDKYFNGSVKDVTFIAYNAAFDTSLVNGSLGAKGYASDLVDFGDEVFSLNQTVGRHHFCMMKHMTNTLRSRYNIGLARARETVLADVDDENLLSFTQNVADAFNIKLASDLVYHDALYDTMVTTYLTVLTRNEE